MDKQHATIQTDDGIKQVLNPIEQARQYMYAVTNKLERDPLLVWPSGSLKGKPFFPYGSGVVFSNITRKQFDDAELSVVISSHLVICQDEMTESIDAEEFQNRLWNMFPIKFTMKLSLPQIDRIRWHMFPEVRIPAQSDLFDSAGQIGTEIPDLIRVMDLQQEQLARSLGDGHRVIHGVAGSGKTLILGYRAEYLAKLCQRPILILCYNKTLAAKLNATIEQKGLADKVTVVNFHAWCMRQLDAYHVEKPKKTSDMNAFFEDCVDRVIQGVERDLIPRGQYDAVMIDEGHDFKPEWFKLVVQMVNPDTKSLLVLYDDAQSIYQQSKKLKFSFSSVGIQAAGRTTILKLNYRNTAEILAVARAFAATLLTNHTTEDDEAPTVQPMSTGRHGPKPILVQLPNLKKEIEFLSDKIMSANKTGTPWNEVGIIYRRYGIGKALADALQHRGIPFQWQQAKGHSYSPTHASVKLMTMHSSKGLEFPLVCIPGLGVELQADEALEDEARLLYVAMTRATHELVMTHAEDSVQTEKLKKAMTVLETM
jgi:superfamily I DNA/RNA helicase